jgi:hypothetical protein
LTAESSARKVAAPPPAASIEGKHRSR